MHKNSCQLKYFESIAGKVLSNVNDQGIHNVALQFQTVTDYFLGGGVYTGLLNKLAVEKNFPSICIVSVEQLYQDMISTSCTWPNQPTI